MIKCTFVFILFINFILHFSTEQNVSNTYELLNKKIKKKIINNFIIDFNSSLEENKDIIIDYKNKEDLFILNNQTYIIFPANNQELSDYADALTLYVKNYTGLEILVAPNVIRKTSNKNKNTFIQIVLDKTLKKAYQIEISRRKMKLSSNSYFGIKNAILLLKRILENNLKKNGTIYEKIEFPSADISMKEQNINFHIIILMIITSSVIYISFKYLK
jgi:hypothetical protein